MCTGPIRRFLAGSGFLALAAVLAAFLVPLGVSLVAAGGSGIGRTGTALAASSGISGFFAVEPGLLHALGFTLLQAGLSACAAVLIGVPAAFLTARRSFPFRRILLALSGVPLCIPPAIIALAFVLFYGRQGYLNVFLMRLFGYTEPPVSFLYSLSGIVFAHGFYNFPVVMRTVSQAWERLPENTAEAATVLGASPIRVFLTVTLPALGSSVVSSAILVFLYCFFSFVIVLLFGAVGVTTLEVELYQAARSALDFARAGKIALIESVTAAAVVALYAAVLRRTNAENSGLRGNRPRTRLKGLSEYLFTALFLAGLLVFFMGPLVSVAVRSFSSVRDSGAGFRFTLEPWKALFGRSSFGTVLFNTVSVGISTAVLSTAAALFFAVWSESGSRSHSSPRSSSVGSSSSLDSTGSHARTRASSSARFRRIPSGTLRFLSVLPLAPLAVSSVMLGFGWTLLVPSGVPALLVLAQSAVSWPIVWSQIQTSLDRVPASVKDAAEVMSDGRLDRAFRVYVPLARKGILSGAAFSFAFSAGDATLPLVLSIGRFENFALRLFRLAGAYRFAEACACALLIALLCAVAFFLQDAEGPERSVHAENKGALL